MPTLKRYAARSSSIENTVFLRAGAIFGAGLFVLELRSCKAVTAALSGGGLVAARPYMAPVLGCLPSSHKTVPHPRAHRPGDNRVERDYRS